MFLRRERIRSGNNPYYEEIQTISVVTIQMLKEPDVFCLKLPHWIVLRATDHSEENISVGIDGVQKEIRSQHLQSESQKRY